MATRLIYLLIMLSFTACGKSPWADYVKENNLGPNSQGKPASNCTLLDADQVQWTQGPFLQNESEFRINFRQRPDFPLKIELFMPDMGHGSVPVQIIQENETSFLVKKVYFIMHGFWEVRIQNARDILCVFPVEIP